MVRIDFNRLRFLVIDDNAHMRRILRTLLHGFGAREVYEAEDGAAGLEAFTHYMPDIILADWVMPIFDGLELTQMIRQPGANANPYVPIIMLTGHSEKKRIVSARDAGVTEFLAKPISAKSLYERILNVVANPRPFIKSKNLFRARTGGATSTRTMSARNGARAARRKSRANSRCSIKPRSWSDPGAMTRNGPPQGRHSLGRDLRRPRSHHAAPRAAQGRSACRRRTTTIRSRAPKRRWPSFPANSPTWMQAECERLEAARQDAKRQGFTEQHARRAVSRRPRHQGRSRDLRLSRGRGRRRESVPASRTHARDRRASRSKLVDQHVDAVRAITREYARPDVADVAGALTLRLRDVTDDFLRRENGFRPDYLESIFSPPLAPGSSGT